LQFCHPVSAWQAEEAVANLPLRAAVRVHCSNQACAQHDGALARLECSEECCVAASSTRLSSRQLERLRRERRIVLLQGLELLVTVLLARNRQPPPTVAAGVPHAELAAELVSLPSGLLAMVCEAIVKLKVRLGACWRACTCV
jgi:hypothetical protein